MKTVILVPVMYSERDLKEIIGEAPPDFRKESDEFWNYIEEKLKQIAPSIRAIYLVWGEGTVDRRADRIVGLLQANGAEVHKIDDRTLVGEARAWYLMAQDSVGGVQEEFLEEICRELGHVLRGVLDFSLGNTGVGVVFFEPVCKLSFGDDVRVIRMAPFDPRDYLTRHLVRKRISGE